jgi:hypothetical protein
MDFSDIQEEMEIPLKRERLCTRFGPASQILGMKIQRDRKSGTFTKEVCGEVA